MSIVEEYWQGVAQRLQVEADVFNRLIQHNGETGRENEASLAEVVRRLLPPTVGVGTGIVIDSQGRRSKQCDLIVFDQNSNPSLLAQTSQMLFPVETVWMVVEVKTTLTSDEIADAASKVSSLRALVSEDARSVPTALFAYQSGMSPSTAVTEVLGLSDDLSPSVACVMRPGIFGRLGPKKVAGLVPLHKQNGSGQPISMTWVEPEDPKALAVTIGASSYPVTSTQAYGKTKVVGNPGRALLLFCAEVLRLLAEVGAVEAHWLDRYMSATASELLEPDS